MKGHVMQKSYKTKVTQEIQQYLKLQKQKSFSASDVYHYLESNNIDVNQSTVYRTLDRMMEQNILVRFKTANSGNYYYRVSDEHHNCDEHLHMQCRKCGRVMHLDCDFMNDIRELNLIQHNHSLIAIRDTFEKENRFLVYYDERWDCKLFLNYKTVDQNNEDVIIDRISADLDVDKRKVSCNYVTSRVQEKYSVSHQENRIYNHRLYEVTLSKYSEKMKKDSFVVNGKRYYWMSVTEMEKDENIMGKNREVVDFVKEKIV